LIVVDFRSGIRDGGHVLRCLGNSNQLAEHGVLVCFRCHFAVRYSLRFFHFQYEAYCFDRVTIWTLNRGPKEAIIWSSVLLLLGNWIRYAGTRASGGHFGVVMFGQILTGLSQPFVLAAPTRYSDLWFTESGRISATAVASLANPFGGAVSRLRLFSIDKLY
jgi:hypothetical protein